MKAGLIVIATLMALSGCATNNPQASTGMIKDNQSYQDGHASSKKIAPKPPTKNIHKIVVSKENIDKLIAK